MLTHSVAQEQSRQRPQGYRQTVHPTVDTQQTVLLFTEQQPYGNTPETLVLAGQSDN